MLLFIDWGEDIFTLVWFLGPSSLGHKQIDYKGFCFGLQGESKDNHHF